MTMPAAAKALTLLLGLSLLTGCTWALTPEDRVQTVLDRLLPTQVLLVGEQHDAPEHQALQADLVGELVRRNRLAAVVLEMASEGQSTNGLMPDASEAQVQAALHWNAPSSGWHWPSYAPGIMLAVRAGIPVIGGNLPPSKLREAMNDARLDALLDPSALQMLQDNIRQAHCDLLPPGQIASMTRVQIARDQSLARSATRAQHPAQTVLLIAGNQHVRRDLGVPLHLPQRLSHRVISAQVQAEQAHGLPQGGVDHIWLSPKRPPRDYCADFRQQLRR